MGVMNGIWSQKYLAVNNTGQVETYDQDNKAEWKFTSDNLICMKTGMYSGKKLAYRKDGTLYCWNKYTSFIVEKVIVKDTDTVEPNIKQDIQRLCQNVNFWYPEVKSKLQKQLERELTRPEKKMIKTRLRDRQEMMEGLAIERLCKKEGFWYLEIKSEFQKQF